MASCGAMNAVVPESPNTGVPLGPPREGQGWRAELHRQRALLRIRSRLLGQCTGARFGVWLARLNAFSFFLAAVYAARSLPVAIEAIARLSLIGLSWCAGLAALSAAGPGPERLLLAGRGLFATRAIGSAEAGVERPLTLAFWICRHIGVLALIVLVPPAVLANSPGALVASLQYALGSAVYVLGLAVGLGGLASACRALGQSNGQVHLLAVMGLPELLAPAFPELPTVGKFYGHLLDACLRLEFGF